MGWKWKIRIQKEKEEEGKVGDHSVKADTLQRGVLALSGSDERAQQLCICC
jgi:hypothetical protein